MRGGGEEGVAMRGEGMAMDNIRPLCMRSCMHGQLLCECAPTRGMVAVFSGDKK